MTNTIKKSITADAVKSGADLPTSTLIIDLLLEILFFTGMIDIGK
jgi:hypothetical protein